MESAGAVLLTQHAAQPPGAHPVAGAGAGRRAGGAHSCPVVQAVTVDPVHPVPLAPDRGIAGEGAVGDDHGDVGAVDRSGSSPDLAHHRGTDPALNMGVLGLDNDPAPPAVAPDDIGGLVALPAHPPRRPAVPDEEITQRLLELLAVHGINLCQRQPQPGRRPLPQPA